MPDEDGRIPRKRIVMLVIAVIGGAVLVLLRALAG